MCRALGIPCRVVTTMNAGIDKDGSLTIDQYVNDPNKRDETCWNFHVWNDVWMARPDLGIKYSGWQAIDATNQVISEGR